MPFCLIKVRKVGIKDIHYLAVNRIQHMKFNSLALEIRPYWLPANGLGEIHLRWSGLNQLSNYCNSRPNMGLNCINQAEQQPILEVYCARLQNSSPTYFRQPGKQKSGVEANEFVIRGSLHHLIV